MNRVFIARSKKDVLFRMILIINIILIFNLGFNNKVYAGSPPYPQSSVISSITWDTSTLVRKALGSDNFPVTWAADGNLYTSWGDGGGFGSGDYGLGVARIMGTPDNFIGSNLWSVPRGYEGGKTYGVISVDGVLYMFVGPNSNFTSCSKNWLMWSNDNGLTWQSTVNTQTFFTASDGFCMPNFLNYGKDYAGARDNYVYFYSYDVSSGVNGPFTDIVLGRVDKNLIKTRSAYEFFMGMNGNTPMWSSNIADRQPVFVDSSRGVFLPSVSYIPGINRYVLVVTHGNGTLCGWGSCINGGGLGIFDAPEPWGPWTTIEYTDNWMGSNNMFFANIPTKQPDWLSDDGETFHLIFTGYNVGGETWAKDAYQHLKGSFILSGPPDTSLPTIPQNLNATSVGESQIDLAWQASTDVESGITKYMIYRDDAKVGESTLTAYTDTGLSRGASYSYEVSAVNGVGLESDRSSSIAVTTLSDTNPPLFTSVSVSSDASKVDVIFSEPVEQTSAENISNYSIDKGIIISAASLGSDLKTVSLSTFTHDEGTTYTLTVNNIEDRAIVPNIIANDTQKTYSYVAQLMISNLSISSGKVYEVVQDGLLSGELIYIDRGYTITNIPSSLEGATFIKTANDDKASMDSSFLSFDVNEDVTVYVAHDDDIASKPSWLSSFTDLGDNLVTSDTTLSIFAKDFPAGNVVLGGNEGTGAASMYIVIITEQGTVTMPDTIPPSPPTALGIN